MRALIYKQVETRVNRHIDVYVWRQIHNRVYTRDGNDLRWILFRA